MARDAASDVGGRTPASWQSIEMIALLTKGRGDSAGTEGEQQVDPLVCGAVEKLRLGGAHRLPDVEGLAEDRVDRPGERGAGLVRRDVEQGSGRAAR
ncbi:hypothetical protein MTX36_15205 [Rhodococcus sp. ARC_M6]|nr:hypothetical protein [Rhodococcus sp. ARC_M6]